MGFVFILTKKEKKYFYWIIKLSFKSYIKFFPLTSIKENRSNITNKVIGHVLEIMVEYIDAIRIQY